MWHEQRSNGVKSEHTLLNNNRVNKRKEYVSKQGYVVALHSDNQTFKVQERNGCERTIAKHVFEAISISIQNLRNPININKPKNKATCTCIKNCVVANLHLVCINKDNMEDHATPV